MAVYLTEQDGYRLKISNKPFPTILAPTAFGTLCEVTPGFIVRDGEDSLRKKLYNTIATPTVSIIDPELTRVLPKKIMVASGLMLMAYGVELFVSKASNPICDTFALRTIDIINNSIQAVVKDPDAKDNRVQLMMASLFTSYGAASGQLGAIYSLVEAITSVNTNLYKGTIAAMMLPQFMEYNLTTASQKYVQIARLMGDDVHKISVLEAAIKAVERVRVLVEECHLPGKLSEIGYDEKDTEEICNVFSRFEEVKQSPRPLTGDDLRTIIEQSL